MNPYRTGLGSAVIRAFVVVFVAIATLTTLATRASAQATIVTGTGNPLFDIPNVQTAVDQGGQVLLQGQFSFDSAPTVLTALVPATIHVGTSVVIDGAPDASIAGGTIPFYVDAAGATVTIQNLHFVRPTNSAILVAAVGGLTVLSCRIQGIVPLPNTPSSGMWISTNGSKLPNPSQPGHPEGISGRLVIANNDIDASGGTADDNTLGITVFNVGGQLPNQQVDIYISGNTIRNVTEPAINFRRIGGRAHVEQNVISTGTLVGKALRPEAIRVANSGSYVIARNWIDCQWPAPDAMGIGVFSQFSTWPMQAASLVDNVVNMSPPPDAVFESFSAGIEVRGFAQYNVVAGNTVRGQARAAVAVDVFNGGAPDNTAFVLNRLQGFEPSDADVVVAAGVTNTLVLGDQGTIDNQDVSTVILPFRPSRAPSVELSPFASLVHLSNNGVH